MGANPSIEEEPSFPEPRSPVQSSSSTPPPVNCDDSPQVDSDSESPSDDEEDFYAAPSSSSSRLDLSSWDPTLLSPLPVELHHYILSFLSDSLSILSYGSSCRIHRAILHDPDFSGLHHVCWTCSDPSRRGRAPDSSRAKARDQSWRHAWRYRYGNWGGGLGGSRRNRLKTKPSSSEDDALDGIDGGEKVAADEDILRLGFVADLRMGFGMFWKLEKSRVVFEDDEGQTSLFRYIFPSLESLELWEVNSVRKSFRGKELFGPVGFLLTFPSFPNLVSLRIGADSELDGAIIIPKEGFESLSPTTALSLLLRKIFGRSGLFAACPNLEEFAMESGASFRISIQDGNEDVSTEVMPINKLGLCVEFRGYGRELERQAGFNRTRLESEYEMTVGLMSAVRAVHETFGGSVEEFSWRPMMSGDYEMTVVENDMPCDRLSCETITNLDSPLQISDVDLRELLAGALRLRSLKSVRCKWGKVPLAWEDCYELSVVDVTPVGSAEEFWSCLLPHLVNLEDFTARRSPLGHLAKAVKLARVSGNNFRSLRFFRVFDSSFSLPSMDFIQAFDQFLRSCPSLTDLEIVSSVQKVGWLRAAEELADMSHASLRRLKLELRTCSSTGGSVDGFTEVARRLPNLRFLEVPLCSLEFPRSFQFASTVFELDVSSNAIGFTGLCSLLRDCPLLEVLHCNNCHVVSKFRPEAVPDHSRMGEISMRQDESTCVQLRSIVECFISKMRCLWILRIRPPDAFSDDDMEILVSVATATRPSLLIS